MKLHFPSLVMLSTLLLLSACVNLDSECMDCFDEAEVFINEFCGNEVDELIENGYNYEFIHMWTLNGEFVLPETTGALPAYDSFGQPIYMSYTSEVTCN